MNYEIKIDNATETKGTIDLHRLPLIADSIRKVSQAREGDAFFSKKPKVETVEQQLERQIRKKGGNQLAQIMGKWPGNETDEEFEQMLKDLD